MDAILQYFKDNPKLILVSVISLLVCLILAIVIIIAKKAISKKRNQEKSDSDEKLNKEEALDEDLEKIDEQVKSEETIDTETQLQPEETTVEEETVAADNTEEVAEKEEKEAKAKPQKALDSTVNKQNDDKKTDTRYSGKWVIIEEGKRFSAELRASNAEILLRTESYTALSGIKSGIETVKNNVEKNNFAVSMDKNGNFFFKLYSSSTRLLCVSEGYSTKAACERAIGSVERFSKTAVIVREKKDDENN